MSAPIGSNKKFYRGKKMRNSLKALVLGCLIVSAPSFATMEAAWNAPKSLNLESEAKVHCPEYIYLKVDGKMVQKSWTHEVISGRSANDVGECVFD